MRKLRTILPLALLAAFLMVSTSYALPSCCQTGDSGNTSTVGSFWGGLLSGFRAPSAPEPAQNYRPDLRQATAPAQSITGTPSANARGSIKPAPIQRSQVSSVPSCCATDGTGYQQSVSRTGILPVSKPGILPVDRYSANYGQVRPQATLGAISSYGGCCGAPVSPGRTTTANLPSCGGTCGGSFAGYRGAPAPATDLPSCCGTNGGSYPTGYRAAPAPSSSSDLPPCCQVPGANSTGYKTTPTRRDVRAVPAVATQKSGNGYYWNTVAGSGPFGKPGYFPAVRNTW
jgi:hypothetical protein